MKLYCRIQTPLGEMIALADGDALRGLRFSGQKHELSVADQWVQAPDLKLFTELRRQLSAYFDGKLRVFDLPLTPAGTPFQLVVWALLRTIPHGATTTYGALAGQLAGQRGGTAPAAQAVGGAVGRNPLAIIVPCHRVIGADGSLTGYAGGLERKAALLVLEQKSG